MSAFIERMKVAAKRCPQRVAFPEGDDEIIMRAGARCAKEGIACPVLVGNELHLRDLCAKRGVDAEAFEFADTADEAYFTSTVERYLALPDNILPVGMLTASMADPLYFAMALTALGDTDATFAGIIASTGDVVMAGQIMVGLAEGVESPSSMGFFDVSSCEAISGDVLAFGDSAICVNPSAQELASIAVSCCDSFADMTGEVPRCALLSHSTDGSAHNELSEKIVEALACARRMRPDLAIDGEFQLDAAILSRVAARKVRRASEVAGKANVVIWPDLDVGNVAVKCVQIFGGLSADGPFLQGFRRIVSDCSRGASEDDVVNNVAVSVARAAALKQHEIRAATLGQHEIRAGALGQQGM